MTTRLETAVSAVDSAYSDRIAALDLAQKVALLTGASMFTLREQESIGLAELRLSDGPTGVRGLTFSGGPSVVLLPNATLLASSWSEDVTYEVGRLLAEEAQAQQIHVVLGPTINLHRTVLGGRLFEAYSEDPLLSGRLAAAYVRGLQDQGVGACLKHLVANESETERHTVNSVVDEVTLREAYLLPFEIAVADADPWSIMAAYNDINGVAATEQGAVINGIVKGEWGYPGLVVSDWSATKTTAASANGGLDLVMPGPVGPWGQALVDAVTAGEVEEAVVDEHVRRLLRLADRVGALGSPRSWPTELPAPDAPVRREQLTRLAAQGITVLRNDGAVLPLGPESSVALIGRHAVDTIDMGGGSAQVNPPYQTSIAEGLTQRLGSRVVLCDGVEVRTRPVPARAGFMLDPVTGEPGVQVSLLREDGSLVQDRHAPTATSMVGIDDNLPEPVSFVRLRASVTESGRIEVGAMGVGDWQVRVADDEVATFALRLSSSDVGEAVLRPPAEITVVDVQAGDLVEATADLRAAAAAGREGLMSAAGLFGLVARPAPLAVEEVVAAAVAAAATADVAVVVVGLTEEQETESVDKTTIRLPGAQDAMVAAVAAAAHRTVVVVNAATPVLMPWLDDVDAVLWAGLPGQEGGHAVAAALLGEIEPSGRLVTTFPVADGAAPAWSVTPDDGRLIYAEGAFIGYRGHHAGRAPDPLFWFGHGLGYATWEYSDARLTADGARAGVTVTVTNTGTRPSREVVQVYLRPADPAQPVRLVGWSAATVPPGEGARVAVEPDPRMWRTWDTGTSTWTDLPASGQLVVARGLGDVRATLDLEPGT